MNDYTKMIIKSPLFRGISKKETDFILFYLKPQIKKYKKGVYITLDGEPVRELMLLLEGSVRIVKDDISGARSFMAQYRPGDYFLEAFACIDAKSPVSSQTAADSLVMAIPYKNIIDMPPSVIETQCKILKNLLVVVGNKALAAHRQIEHVSKPGIRKKIMSYLSAQKSRAGKKEFIIPLSKTDLADFLFINRSAMTRELAAMRKEKLLNFKGRKFTLPPDIKYNR
ncbi:MAG: Crp/Fnr family transcriptional regulator [Elusimicrobia bacterium]|nr:Crp/Fnr family transcriptional regulator [Elusimicrobiota bacterium]